VRGFETALNSEIDLLMTRLAEIADGKTTVSMMEEFDHLTLDTQNWKIIFKIHSNIQSKYCKNRQIDMQQVGGFL
jgi:hypothetical protein